MELSILVGLLVYFILAVLEPFGTHLSTTPHKSIRLIGIGFISGGMVYISDNVLPKKFSGFYNVHSWTIGKAIVHTLTVLLIIGLIIAIYLEIVFPDDPTAPDVFRCILFTYLIGIIPSIVITGWKYIKFLERQQKQSMETSPSLSVMESSIRLRGSTNGREFVINTSDIILFSAMGNYVIVYYDNDAKVEKQIIRKTISSIKESLIGENYIRCHRSHIVNMDKVLSLEGNLKSMKLMLRGIDDKIQVSRRYVPVIRGWIAQSHFLH